MTIEAKLADLMPPKAEANSGLTFTVKFTVSQNWIDDGFKPTEEMAQEMIEHQLPYAYEHEVTGTLASAPEMAAELAKLRASNAELVKALKRLYEMGEYQRTITNDKQVGNVYAQARTALAQAEGRAQ